MAAALPDRSRVVAPEADFASALFPWLAQAHRGVEVRTVPLDRLVESIDRRTDAVVFSLVQSVDGAVVDYPAVVAAAREHDALVVVDATQACGWLPFDASVADAVVTSGYKWLMTPRGAAFGASTPAYGSIFNSNPTRNRGAAGGVCWRTSVMMSPRLEHG